jgi:four helix bundle protein
LHEWLHRGTIQGYPWRHSIHKIGIAEKEASETQYWLELIHEVDIGDRQALLTESTELLAIFTSIGKTAKQRT